MPVLTWINKKGRGKWYKIGVKGKINIIWKNMWLKIFFKPSPKILQTIRVSSKWTWLKIRQKSIALLTTKTRKMWWKANAIYIKQNIRKE